jgi:hypothetical protein
MGPTRQQASDLENDMRIVATGQNIRSRPPQTAIVAARQDVPNGLCALSQPAYATQRNAAD